MPTMRAEILSIGTELLLGQIVDTNAAYLAGRLALLGIDCLHKQTVGDNLGRATDAFRLALSRTDLVVATGGLGPTEDDLTREAIAAALDETPTIDPALEAELRDWFAGRGLAMPERNRKQAWLIPSAQALPNPNGTAPGWDVRRDGRRLGVGDALTAGERARPLAAGPEAARWLAGALVVPGADASTPEREVRPPGPQVIRLGPAGASESELRLYAPDRPRGQTIRYRTPAEARRRALLSGLDLLRRALAN